jgi:quinohemoprotein amine dehydrogenase
MQTKKATTPAILTWYLLAASVSLLIAAPDTPRAGIPIDDPLTITKCGGCHSRDGNGMMRRMSYVRTTPEVWEQNIKRMTRLNGVTLTADEARKILRYLSRNNGLAPEEAKPVFWEAEHRRFRDQDDDKLVPEALRGTCITCHTIGRVLTQRRTREDYEKLANLHMGLYRYTELMVFRPRTPSVLVLPVTAVAQGSYGASLSYPTLPQRPAKDPIDIALDYLATNQPLITPEWTAWKASMRTPNLAGAWLMSGYQKGKGKLYGQMTIEAIGDDEFTTKIEVKYANTGRVVTRTGKGIVYTGYSWRGRSKLSSESNTPSADPNYAPAEDKEALFISRDGASVEGRWYWGGYDEFGIDVRLTRLGKEPVVLGTDLYGLKSPSTAELHIFGGGFPASLKPSEVDLGAGVQVSKVIKATPTEATLQVTLAAGLPTSKHDITVGHSTAVNAFAVYDKIAYIKVEPDANMARLGGTIVAKQYAQFEAVAYAAGPDGKPETADDVALGPVPASWSMEEFFSTPNDDDVEFVGSVNDSGLFTPSGEGPNPKRKKQTNNLPTDNYGDVWIDASFTAPGGGAALRAKSYLVVSVPLYIHFDQPEVSQ